MKKSVNSNIYGYALDSTWECYADFLTGARQAVVCIVSLRPVSEQSCMALEKSFAKLGFGENACTFLVLEGAYPNAADRCAISAGCDTSAFEEDPASGSSADVALGAQDVFTIIEGLDPLAVVAADAQAAEVLGKAYRTGFDACRKARLLGRDAVAFASFDSMLASEDDKQKAWATLKLLAR